MADDIQIGDRVRSFDFDDRSVDGDDACYIEGKVTGYSVSPAYGYRVYVIATDLRVFGGEHEKVLDGHTTYVPVNGTPTIRGRVTNGVVNLTSHGAVI